MIGNIITAMPDDTLLPLTIESPYVAHWYKKSVDVWKYKRNSPKVALLERNQADSTYKAKVGQHELYFVMAETLSVPTLAFFYLVQPTTLVHRAGAAECLAFSVHGHGYIRDLFFNHIIPDHKFVVTDADYTSNGKTWFDAQYTHVKRQPERYAIHALDLDKNIDRIIDMFEFDALQPTWWGKGMQHLRFAVELKG